ncbi:unnamed protein product [Staurois parvus]|uniref:Uncharacterized protein n=1 Tax=Staurois parvus TaxID=386267 RepID=A0ABN9ETG1_9NEOB|nr:unnamed protein product [Staurois parvus]
MILHFRGGGCFVYQQSSSLSAWAHCTGWLSRAIQSNVLYSEAHPPPSKILPAHS